MDNKASHLHGKEREKWRLDRVKKEVEALKTWLEKNRYIVAPGSLTGKAIGYSLKNFDALMKFLDNGDLELTNNIAERAIKQFVIGRKNFLFIQSIDGANASGVIFSIVETAKLYGLNPYKYIKYFLEELSQKKHTYEMIESVLPWSDTLPAQIRSRTES